MIKSLNKFLFLFIFGLLILSILLIICSCTKIDSYSSHSIEVTDLCNRTATIQTPVKKIIALAPSDCEVFYQLDAGDLIIGRGSDCDYPSDVVQKEDYGTGDTLNIEKIISAKPDIITMPKMGFSLDTVNKLEAAGIITLVNQIDSLDDLYKYIYLLARVTNKDEAAKNLVSNIMSSINQISLKSKEAYNGKTKTIFFDLWKSDNCYWTCGKNTLFDEISNILNVKNVFDDINGWSQVEEEMIIKKNPDIIVYCGSKSLEEPLSVLYAARGGWKNIEAIKNNNLYFLNSDIFNRPGPRIVDAINTLYENIYS